MSRIEHARRPLVAMTTTTEVVRALPRVRVNARYPEALARAGAIPVAVPPLDPALADALLHRVDGLLLTGGEDVESCRYGQPPHPRAERPNPARDLWELALVRAARARQIPTLAICRGLQIANVALGGSMIQDIADLHAGALVHTREDVRTSRVHPVAIEPRSRLATALGAERMLANSLHHQSLDHTGDGLRVVARAEDGVVEGAEWSDDDWWMVGVQWHPEELDDTAEPWDRALFAAFVRVITASSATASRREPGA